MPRKPKHPVTQYATDIVKKKIISNKWVLLACKRHLKDLKTGKKRGLYFDENAADHIIDFFPEFLVLYDGAVSGQPFVLTPLLAFIAGSLFGWKREADGFRRFQTAYIEMAKGQIKTPLAAGIGLYCLTFDDEPGAEIYSAATTRDQAGLSFRDARLYAEASESLQEMLTINQHNIAYLDQNSFFRPISSEGRGLDGKKPHVVLIDELQEHPNDIVVRKMSAGTKSRRQPIIFEITNSGHDRSSICFQHHDYTCKILEEILKDDEWFGLISGLDVCKKCESEGKTIPQDGCKKCDDWRNPKSWPKSNPNLDYLGAPFKRYLEKQVAQATAMPKQENIVKRLNFCIWTESIMKWIPAQKWNACTRRSLKIEDFKGMPCYIGLDLASKIDMCSVIILFPLPTTTEDEKPHFAIFCKNYLPEDTVKDSKNKASYDQWIKGGHITVTPGARTDFKYIEDDIKEINADHPIQQLAFDPKEATYLVNNIMEWTDPDTCIEINQGPTLISEPMKELEARVYAKQIWHDGNPVLAWMISNVVLKSARSKGPVKYYYPTKESYDNKIDGAVSLIMAVGRAMLEDGPTVSVYESRGVLTF